MRHSMRNQLTALGGFARLWARRAKERHDPALTDTADETNRIVGRMVGDLSASLDGPFAGRHVLAGGHVNADVNAPLAALRKRFAAATSWTTQQKSVELFGLTQPLLVLAAPLRLLSA